jgi:hypothetical protein
MQYLLVSFAEARRVIIDETVQGMTNELLELEEGTYRITLEGTLDFVPDMREIILRRTSELNPRVVCFEKK